MADELNKTSDGYEKDPVNMEQIERNNKARKRIDDLMEKKRLKYLLDDCEDWEL